MRADVVGAAKRAPSWTCARGPTWTHGASGRRSGAAWMVSSWASTSTGARVRRPPRRHVPHPGHHGILIVPSPASHNPSL